MSTCPTVPVITGGNSLLNLYPYRWIQMILSILFEALKDLFLFCHFFYLIYFSFSLHVWFAPCGLLLLIFTWHPKYSRSSHVNTSGNGFMEYWAIPSGADDLGLSFQVRREEGNIDFWVSKAPGGTLYDLLDHLEVVILRAGSGIHTGDTAGVFNYSCALCVERSVGVSVHNYMTAWETIGTDAMGALLGDGRFPEDCVEV